MNIICSPVGIIDIDRPGQGIIDMEQAGFADVLFDMSLCCRPNELEARDKATGQAAKRVLDRTKVFDEPTKLSEKLLPMMERCKQAALHHSVAYAPYLCRDTKHPEWKEQLVKLIEESIRVCGQADCKYIVIRPWFAGVAAGQEWEVNQVYYLHFASIAKENGVMILLENQCKDVNGHLVRGICSNATEAVNWIDTLNKEVGEELFGFCMDTGVNNLCGQNMYDYVLSLGSRLKAVILRDNDGNTESAMLPFTGVSKGRSQTDWLSLIRGLREAGFDGELILNFADTAQAFSPILRPMLLKMAKSVADYFKWQIEIENLLRRHSSIVLFGAGNMCRNYMKCYGEKYPPLFTCDNNSNLWGTTFCGLEVKAPERLRDLPKDCTIFICNIYYREIEKQLREMNITNPIAFFNDEYMPTFYFDRVEDGGR